MKRNCIFLLVISVLLILGAVFEARTNFTRRIVDDMLYDNRFHYLPCDRLPEIGVVERVVREKQAVLDEILRVNLGMVGYEVDSLSCPGKADLLFWYGTHDQRLRIVAIIGADDFFGIPYNLQNR